MAVAYLDHDGKLISQATYEKCQADQNYRVLRQYDNNAVRIELLWTGKIANYGQVFPDFYKLFTLRVHNYRDGALVKDITQDGQTFPTMEKAIAGYETLLLQWTDCVTNSEGDFVEVDNTLTPPPPPNPDRPENDAEDMGGVGAW